MSASVQRRQSGVVNVITLEQLGEVFGEQAVNLTAPSVGTLGDDEKLVRPRVADSTLAPGSATTLDSTDSTKKPLESGTSL